MVTSAAPPRRAARAESNASFMRASRLAGELLRLLLAAEAKGRARGVEGHEAAADDHDPAAQVHAVAAVDVQQVVHRLDDTVQLDAGHLQVAPARHADGEEDGPEALSAQLGQPEGRREGERRSGG